MGSSNIVFYTINLNLLYIKLIYLFIYLFICQVQYMYVVLVYLFGPRVKVVISIILPASAHNELKFSFWTKLLFFSR